MLYLSNVNEKQFVIWIVLTLTKLYFWILLNDNLNRFHTSQLVHVMLYRIHQNALLTIIIGKLHYFFDRRQFQDSAEAQIVNWLCAPSLGTRSHLHVTLTLVHGSTAPRKARASLLRTMESLRHVLPSAA